MNVKTKAVIGIVLALVIGFFLFGGTSQAASVKKGCVVVNVKVVEEPDSGFGETKYDYVRWVRTDTVQCGKKFSDLTTYGRWQKTPVFRDNR